MKKTFKILAFSLFAITGFTVVSCDNEGYDPIIEGELGVGKPTMTINNQGDVILLREGIVATLDKDGILEIKVAGADKSGQDSLILRALKFQTGTFPTNANKCEYYSWENKLRYTTIDKDRPTFITGLLKINTINRKARVLSGDFNITRMIPENQDNPNLKAFAISGDFKDIRFVRKEATYLEAFVNEEPLENPKEKAEIKGNNIVITSIDGVEMTQELIIELPNNDVLEASSDPKEFKNLGWFNVLYTSKYGVKYTSEGMDDKDGLLRIDAVEYKNNKIVSLKGRFEAMLRGADEGKEEERVKITFGDFSVKF
ncbi:hypothetical protein LNQ81_01175 [Myroides sp. M-43]|uniref:hypothetical protein n=1 Tax=Myroides oncorhynchi TaxID=2893756 RepID=UPI001E37E581|nr:hypothetical protein [Myroides oncorhynchi]MCC9041345.1 hypothetical protein [Myroides oncorhynchi]